MSDSSSSYLQDVEVTLKVLSKWVLASSEAVEEQHAKAEDICAVPLTGVPPAACYQLLWCLPSTAATCHHHTCLITFDREGTIQVLHKSQWNEIKIAPQAVYSK